jgi:microcystin-dependent protein
MELYIYNKELDLMGVFDTANAVIWNRRYYAPGEFEIHTAATEIALYLIQKQYLVAKPDSVEFGIIENVTIEQTEEGEFIKATGRFGSSILARRIVFETTIISDTVENAMRSLVYDNVINPDIAARAISNIELGTLNSFAETVQFQVSYRNLLSTLTGLAETSGIGYRLRFDPALQKFYFETYKALDRSAGQSVNSRAIFSNDYDNLLTSLYQTSDMEISNVALVGGEGEGTDRKMVVVGTGSGADRYEVFVNAKEVRMEDGITEPDYYAMLAQKGAESLLPSIEYFEGSVLPEGNLIYKTDYDLGDIVTIENVKWNKRIDVQITEITEVYDEYGARTLIPIFGQATPTLADALSGREDTSGSGSGGSEIVVTANKALVSDSTGKMAASSVTTTELEHLTGVTGNVQAQLNGKAAASHTHTASQITDFLNKVYPVGSIYMSVVNTSPATLFGGTWSAFGAGRTLVGFDVGQTEFNAAEKTGGAKTHVLIESEMPSHTHVQNSHNHTQNAHNHVQDPHSHRAQFRLNGGSGTARDIPDSTAGNYKALNTWNENTTATNQATTATNQATTATNQNTGGGAAHNNLQPYITVYMWKRTA